MERCEKATLIYLDDGCMLLSKKDYSSWKEVQDEYEKYQANLLPVKTLLTFLKWILEMRNNGHFLEKELLSSLKVMNL